MDETPHILKLGHGLEMLAYKDSSGFRIDSWKFPSGANDRLFRTLDEPTDELRSRRFATLLALIRAVTDDLYRQ